MKISITQENHTLLYNIKFIDKPSGKLTSFFLNKKVPTVLTEKDLIPVVNFVKKKPEAKIILHLPDGIEVIASTSVGKPGVFSDFKKSLQAVFFPPTLRVVGDHAFSGCTELKTLHFPQSLLSVGRRAFYECYKLKHIIFPKNMDLIGLESFSKCESLEKLKLPHFLNKMSDFAFSGCLRIKKVTFPKTLFQMDQYCFALCEGLSQVILPENLQSLSKGTFEGCVALREISFPNSLIKIEENCFSGCVTLEEVHFSTSLEFIGKKAFFNCSQLKSVELPKNLLELSEEVFSRCQSLQQVYLYKSVKITGPAFKNCSSLEYVKVEELDKTTLAKEKQGNDRNNLRPTEVISNFPLKNLLDSGAFEATKNFLEKYRTQFDINKVLNSKEFIFGFSSEKITLVHYILKLKNSMSFEPRTPNYSLPYQSIIQKTKTKFDNLKNNYKKLILFILENFKINFLEQTSSFVKDLTLVDSYPILCEAVAQEPLLKIHKSKEDTEQNLTSVLEGKLNIAKFFVLNKVNSYAIAKKIPLLIINKSATIYEEKMYNSETVNQLINNFLTSADKRNLNIVFPKLS